MGGPKCASSALCPTAPWWGRYRAVTVGTGLVSRSPAHASQRWGDKLTMVERATGRDLGTYQRVPAGDAAESTGRRPWRPAPGAQRTGNRHSAVSGDALLTLLITCTGATHRANGSNGILGRIRRAEAMTARSGAATPRRGPRGAHQLVRHVAQKHPP